MQRGKAVDISPSSQYKIDQDSLLNWLNETDGQLSGLQEADDEQKLQVDTFYCEKCFSFCYHPVIQTLFDHFFLTEGGSISRDILPESDKTFSSSVFCLCIQLALLNIVCCFY